MKNIIRIYIVVLILIGVLSCSKNELLEIQEDVLQKYLNIPKTPFNYASPDLPAFFKNQFVIIQDNTPANNPVTNWGATLGRVLFYDKDLSFNRSISCASCHIQEFGFTDTAQFSKGFNGGFTKRHSMSLANAKYYSNGRFFWDERAGSLEEQVLQPILDAVEMGMSLQEVIHRIQNKAYYHLLFQHAFGDITIDKEHISKALAQFVRSIISYRSKYDQGRSMVSNRTDDFPNFSTEENIGKEIFMTNTKVTCFSCHNTDALITDNPRNNGVHLENKDSGIAIHTLQSLDMGKFKAPSLKNIALRGRFMHDGSFSDLGSVIEHYNSGILPNPNLDPHLINISNGSPIRMNLSVDEVNALKEFLGTLTDHELIHDEKFRNPFL